METNLPQPIKAILTGFLRFCNFVNKYISVKDIKNYSVTTDVDPKLKEIFTSYKYSLNQTRTY